MEIELLGGNYGELELDGDITWTFLISNSGNDVDRAFLTLHDEGDEGIEVLGNSQPLPGFIISLHEGSLVDNELGASIGIDSMGKIMLGSIDAGDERIVRVHVVVDAVDLPAINTQKFGNIPILGLFKTQKNNIFKILFCFI